MAASIDVSNTASLSGESALRRDNARLKLAQKVIPTRDAGVTSVELVYSTTLTVPSGNSWVEIWSDNGGVPGSQLGGDSATVASASAHNTPAFTAWNWSANHPQTYTNTPIWIVMDADYSVDINSHLRPQNAPNVSFAQTKYWNGSAWVDSGDSAAPVAFKLYSDPDLSQKCVSFSMI